MNPEKIGKFIKKLRNEKKLSQNKLAEMIPVTRQAVSNWENGKASPDSQVLIILSEIFDVTIDEIILGRRIKKEEIIEAEKEVKLSLFDENNNQKKKLKRITMIFLISIIILILSFLLYYFINNYNSIKVYRIEGSNDNFITKKGIFINTKQKSYLRLGRLEKINKETTINNVKLYYIDDNNIKDVLFEDEDNDIFISEKYGNKDILISNKLEYIINNLYLEINYNDNQKDTIKLKAYKDFSNDLITYDKEKSIKKDKDKIIIVDKNNILKLSISKLIEKVEPIDNKYDLEIETENEKIRITYINNILVLNVKNGSEEKYYTYYEDHKETVQYRIIKYDSNRNKIEENFDEIDQNNNIDEYNIFIDYLKKYLEIN